MNPQPLSLSLFRLLLTMGVFAFMAMLYWSSTLIEKDLKVIHEDLGQIKDKISTLQEGGLATRREINSDVEEKASLLIPKPSLSTKGNLLEEDPFYAKTLPAMLGPRFQPHGTRREAAVIKPNNLHPFSNMLEISSWNSLCTLSLTGQKVGIYETYVPEMAYSMELKKGANGRPEFWIFLRRNVFWEPLNPQHFSDHIQLAPVFLEKHPVTAHDFKFFFDAVMNPHVEEEQAVALRNFYSDVEEVKAVDDYTLVVRWKTFPFKDEEGKVVERMKYLAQSFTGGLRPLPRFVYQYFADGTKIVPKDEEPNTYRTNPIWAQNFSQHWAKQVIVSCGPWIFDGITDREIRFKRNPHYFNPLAVLFKSYEIRFRESPDSIWQDFKTNAVDLFSIPPNLLNEFAIFLKAPPYLEQLRQGLGVKRLDYLSRSYTYIGWNQANPLFQSRKVRQALTHAIDRERIIRQNLNGMGMQITGTFFPFSPSYDPNLKPYSFDPDKARRLLEEEGWYDSSGDGILDKTINGKKVPFRFSLSYYVKNPTTKSICDYISTALKEIGIECNLNGVDVADLSALFEDKGFDAIFLGWALGTPPEDPKQLWYSKGAKEKGSSNAIGFVNQEVDAIINQLEYEYNPEKRIALYHRFNAIIHEEAPYTFLYTPKTSLAYREYLQNVFIPANRTDLIPGANVGEPQPAIFWKVTVK